MSRAKIVLCLLAQAAVIAGMASYYLWGTGKMPGIREPSGARHGLVTGIFCAPENASAVIDGKIVHEGETIHGVKVAKIDKDKVQFEKHYKRWSQKPREEPSQAWPKRAD